MVLIASGLISRGPTELMASPSPSPSSPSSPTSSSSSSSLIMASSSMLELGEPSFAFLARGALNATPLPSTAPCLDAVAEVDVGLKWL